MFWNLLLMALHNTEAILWFSLEVAEVDVIELRGLQFLTLAKCLLS